MRTVILFLMLSAAGFGAVAAGQIHVRQNQMWQSDGNQGFEVYTPYDGDQWNYFELKNITNKGHYLARHYIVTICEGLRIWPERTTYWSDSGTWTYNTEVVGAANELRNYSIGRTTTVGNYMEVTVPAGYTHLYGYFRTSTAQSNVGVTVESGSCTLNPGLTQYADETYDGIFNADLGSAHDDVPINSWGILGAEGMDDLSYGSAVIGLPGYFYTQKLVATNFSSDDATVIRFKNIGSAEPDYMEIFGFVALKHGSSADPDTGVVDLSMPVYEVTKGYSIGCGNMFYVAHDNLDTYSAMGEGHFYADSATAYDGEQTSPVETVILSNGDVWWDGALSGSMSALATSDAEVSADTYGIVRNRTATLTLGNKAGGESIFEAGTFVATTSFTQAGYESQVSATFNAASATNNLVLHYLAGGGLGWSQWALSRSAETIQGINYHEDPVVIGTDYSVPADIAAGIYDKCSVIANDKLLLFGTSAETITAAGIVSKMSPRASYLTRKSTTKAPTVYLFMGEADVDMADGDKVVWKQWRLCNKINNMGIQSSGGVFGGDGIFRR
ncbi:MAG: hypothetical protein WC551_11060 [Patescibacteria group bacterium]